MAEEIELSTGNRLLASMSDTDKALLRPHLQRVPLKPRMSIQKPDTPIEYAYFPETAIASVVGIASDGLAEIALIGREGVTAFPLVLGGDRSPHEIFIQVPGAGLQIAADTLRSLMSDSEALRARLLAYMQAFITQISYNALAGSRLKLEGRLARWILMCRDRIEGDELAITHEFVAVMLGVRRPGVTLAFQALEARGLIYTSRGKIDVVDRMGLEQLADGFYGVAEREYGRLIR